MKQEKKYFYVDDRSGEVLGPNSLEEIKGFQFLGRVSMDTEVFEEGTEDRMPFGEVLRMPASGTRQSSATEAETKWFEFSIVLAIVGFLVPSLFYVSMDLFDEGWDFFANIPFALPIINILQGAPALFFILLYRRLKQGNEDPFSFTAN
ncbi:MAG: hypothetical protein VYB61_11670 [Verrucomicrobiota bacterium]|nr:hypothetical protein [Verrucomicrobiota bacterium]